MSDKSRIPGSNRDDEEQEKNTDRPAGSPRLGSPFSSGTGNKPSDSSGKLGSLFAKLSDTSKSDSPSGNKPNDPSKPSSPFGNKPNDPPKPPPNFGSKPGDPPRPPSTFGNKPNDPPKPSSPFGGNKPNDPPKPPPTFGNKPNDPSKPSSPFGGNKPNDPPKPSSPFGGNKPNDPPKPPPTFGNKPNDPSKPSSPFGGNRPNDPPKPPSTFGSKPSSSFGARPDDPKRDAPASPKLDSPTTGKPGDQKDDKSAGGGFLGRFGGSKPADKPGDKPATPKLGSPTPSKPGAKPDDKKDDKSAGGGFLGRFGGGKPADPKAPAPKSTPTDPKRSSSTMAAATGSSFAPPLKSADASKPGSKIPPARGDKVAKPLDRPTTQLNVKRGLSLDQKLDLIGYALIITALVMFGGIIQPSEGSVTSTIAKILGQLFGYGRLVWPVVAITIGGWLLIRRFKASPFLEVDYVRLVGWILMFVTLVVTLQFLELLQKPVASMGELAKISATTAQSQTGGGWLGDKLYYFLIGVVNEWGVPIVLGGCWLVSIMLALQIELAELAIYIKSVVRYFGRMRRGFIERNRVRQERRAAALVVQPAVTIEKAVAPAAATLGGPSATPTVAGPADQKSLPEPATAGRQSTRLPSLGSGTPIAPQNDANKDGDKNAPRDKDVPVPAAKPAPPPLGSGTVAKPAESGKPGTFGTATPAKATTGAFARTDQDNQSKSEPVKEAVPALTPNRPNPLGTATPAKPGAPGGVFARLGGNADKGAEKTIDSKLAEVATKTDEKQQAPADPKSSKPGSRPGLFGGVFSRSKPSESTPGSPKDDAQNGKEAKETAPAKDAPEKQGSAISPQAASVQPATATQAKPGSGVFGKPVAASTPQKNNEPPGNKPDANNPQPSAPIGNRPSTPGTSTTPFAKSTPTAQIEADDDNKDKDQDEPDGSNLKPATPIGNRPGSNPSSFGTPAKPTPFAKPAAPTAEKAVSGDNKDNDQDEPDASNLKPATPVGNRPSPNPFGTPAKPTPFASPFAKGASPVTKDKDETPKNVESEKAAASATSTETLKPATPMGNRPMPSFAPAPGAKPVPKPGSSSQITPTKTELIKDESADDVAYVPLDDESTTTDDKSRPAPAPVPPVKSPFGAKPTPFASSTPKTEDKKVPDAAKVEVQSEPTPAVAPVNKVPASTATAPKQSTPPAPSAETGPVRRGGWLMPDTHELLETGSSQAIHEDVLRERAKLIEETLQSFGAPGKVVETNTGPVITQFGVEPDYLVSRQGKRTRVKVSAIARLDADLALALAARSIRIEAPVPGKGYVGIEVPNAETALVGLRDIMDSDEFKKLNTKLRIALGKSVDGTPIVADLTAMPHLLIAGTTGSGKSVCVNAIISCLLLQNSPEDLKLIMVDPKRVELTGYNGIPHLVSPVVVDLERIVGVLKWVSREMDERYKKFSAAGARNLIDYNNRTGPSDPKLPYLVLIVDELADLMMLAPEETEKVLTRLAQMARATGIHLIIATQRPSVDVVTGLIKANFPARISFAVASSVDSRVILDQPGAEKLLGRGDMLYQAPDAAAPLRVQGVYVSDAEITRITKHWKEVRFDPGSTKLTPALTATTFNATEKPAEPVQSRMDRLGGPSRSSGPTNSSPASGPSWAPSRDAGKPAIASSHDDNNGEEDDMYDKAVDVFKKMGKISASLLVRQLRIGFGRAEQLIKLMKERGVLGGGDGNLAEDNGN